MKKQFKAESKKLLDLMINSIYSNKEIFLREMISNASDAIDKLYYRSLTDKKVKLKREDFYIRIDIDKENHQLIISDNGCGMTEEELEVNLGTIAKSGTQAFREENKDKHQEIDIIGQFGVGFYSAFMVSDRIDVVTKAYGEQQAYHWSSTGVDGYTIEKCEKDDYGTIITLSIKDDESTNEFLESYRIQGIIKKYSDYIRYPIQMEIEHQHKKENSEEVETHKELTTINSMIPLWKKNKKEVSDEDYEQFYQEKFYDYEKPLHVIHSHAEGLSSYHALMYIPSHAPYDYYTKEYEKGLALYANGVMIMEKCSDLLPDYFSFVKGLVDSEDLSLNISREMLQQDKTLHTIAKSIEKKIKSELESLLKNDRNKYLEFFKAFGMQLKFGVYNRFGMDKDELKDLIMFYSNEKKELITLKEYVEKKKEGQDKIYYAVGETIDKIDLLPQVELVKDKGFDLLYLTDYVDEFVVQTLGQYENMSFVNIASEAFDLDGEEEKKKLEEENKSNKDLFDKMKDFIDVNGIRLTHRLKNHPVCLSNEGNLSIGMEKVLNNMPTDEKVKAQTILEINANHPIVHTLKDLYQKDVKRLEEYTKLLYNQARLIEGLSIDNPVEFSSMICELMSK